MSGRRSDRRRSVGSSSAGSCGRRRLAAARLADEAERLAARDVEARRRRPRAPRRPRAGSTPALDREVLDEVARPRADLAAALAAAVVAALRRSRRSRADQLRSSSPLARRRRVPAGVEVARRRSARAAVLARQRSSRDVRAARRERAARSATAACRGSASSSARARGAARRARDRAEQPHVYGCCGRAKSSRPRPPRRCGRRT
jgi:hypothetical protein